MVISVFMKNKIEFKLLEEECQICLMEHDSEKLTQLECKHVFHSHCIEEWLGYQSKLGRDETCPTCRALVKNESEEEEKTDVCCFSFCFGYRKKNR